MRHWGQWVDGGSGGVKNDPRVSNLDEILECLPTSVTLFSSSYPHSQGGSLSWNPIVLEAWHSSYVCKWTLPSFWKLPTPHAPSMVIMEATVLTHDPFLGAPGLRWENPNSSTRQ